MDKPLRSKNLRFIFSFILLSAVLLTVRPVLAHVDNLVLQGSNIPLGPYALTVWTYPDTMEPGPLDVVVSIEDPATKQPILDCEVVIGAAKEGTGAQLTPVKAPPGRDPTERFRYETSINLPEAGVYDLTVTATNPAGDSAQVTFPIVVKSLTYFRIALTLLVIITVLAMVWFIYEGANSLRRYASSARSHA